MEYLPPKFGTIQPCATAFSHWLSRHLIWISSHGIKAAAGKTAICPMHWFMTVKSQPTYRSTGFPFGSAAGAAPIFSWALS